MTAVNVWVFFYGSYMNPDVLKEASYAPREMEVARLSGFDIRIGPLANLVRSDEHSVYGLVTEATHEELARLYAHAEHVLGAVYLPEAVLVETRGGLRPALCYIAASMKAGPAAGGYVDRILAPARTFGFPDWYLRRLESFRTDR